MSRAFVKEDDSGEPPIIAPRASLPPGTPNYVTPRGLTLLREELEQLEAQRSLAEANREDEANRTRQLTILKSQISALLQRINTAKVVEPAHQSTDEVRFGATVSLKTKNGGKPGFKRTFTIVGVDEASIADSKIGFVAPIARAVIGAKKGDLVNLRIGKEEETVEVVEINYSP